MKKLLIFLLLISSQLTAQKTPRNHEIGIGLGRVINYYDYRPVDDWLWQSPLYSNATFGSPNTTVIHFFQSPTLYYQYRINEHLKFVSSLHFVSSRTLGTVQFSSLALPYPGFTTFSENKRMYAPTIGLSAGTENKFGRFYIGAQIGTSIQSGKRILYNYDKSKSIKQSITSKTEDIYFNPTPRFFGEILMGGQARLTSFMSFNLEGGVVHTAFLAPISRLSFNYHF